MATERPPVTPAPMPPALADALGAAAARLGPFGSRVLYFPTTGSTNDVLADEAARGAPEGTVVVADAQTRGRGRSGRTWFSPPSAGLYVSVLLRPRPGADGGAPPWARLITLAAGVALADGLRVVSGLPIEIKWPNDLVVHDGTPGATGHWRKIAGILAEGQTEAGHLRHVVLGCGVNVSDAAYPAELADRAASLEGRAGRPLSRGDVLVEMLAALRREYEALAHGPHATLIDRWRSRSPLASGAPVAWGHAGEREQGVTAGITAEGALLVQGAAGLRALSAGEVTWL
jgi:BirA family transcriptional regulator, biotin operon repressor / biotin---[acetyl-CoA-carboxylase] ligase